ncbi:MAG: hypothetical protein ACHQD9_05240, partial [Chitinophagales bacterium]
MRFHSTLICVVVLILFSLKVFSQKETNNWYFGNYAGLDFNSGSPVVLTNSAMSAFEGCSTISDSSGNLLFYTDGMTVWNKNHEFMSNGNGLYGNSSSTQCLIVKQPETPSTYYIFTEDAQLGTWGFRYSILDMSLQNGLGEVTDKNVPIYDSSTEKICAIDKSSSETWIMSHEWNSNTFLAQLLDGNGLSSNGVQSNVGTVMDGNNDNVIGYMKFSPNGKRIAYSIDYDLKRVEVFDFDVNTGSISNALVLDSVFTGYGAYGIEFSPNSKILYAANEGLAGPYPSHVHQWNLAAGTNQDIINSKVVMDSLGNAGALQLASNGKIYLAQTNTSYLGVINFPDSAGTSCNFEDSVIDLSPAGANYGLPGFNASLFEHPDFLFFGFCYKDSTFFSVSDSGGVDSVLWNFDDPPSGIFNTSTSFDTYHIFTASGNYEVELIKYINGATDTFTSSVTIYDAPFLFFGNDTSICSNQTLLLNAGSNFSSYLWQDGSTDSIFTVTNAGQYYVRAIAATGCVASDSIIVNTLAVPVFSLGDDTAICQGSTLILDPNNPGPIFLWQDGSTNSTFTVSDGGLYWVKVTNQNGCSSADSIQINILPSPPVPSILFVNGTLISTIYLGNQWFLNGAPIAGADLNYYVPTENGTYQVMVIDSFGCYSLSDPYAVTTVGIEEEASDRALEIFPNPFHEFCTLKINSATSSVPLEIIIINSQGQLLR